LRPVAELDKCDAWANNLASRYKAPVEKNAELASFNLAVLIHLRTVTACEHEWIFSTQIVGEQKTILTACIDALCFDSIHFLEEYVTGEGEFTIDLAPAFAFDEEYIQHKITVELHYDKQSKTSLQIKNIASKQLQKNDDTWTECTLTEKDSKIEGEQLELVKKRRYDKSADHTPTDLKQCSGWYKSEHPCSDRATMLATGFMDAFMDSDSRLHHDTYNYEDSDGDQMRILRTSVDDVALVEVWPEFNNRNGPFQYEKKGNLRHAVMQWIMRSKLPWCPKDFKLHVPRQRSEKECDFIHVAINGDHEVEVTGATYNGHEWKKHV